MICIPRKPLTDRHIRSLSCLHHVMPDSSRWLKEYKSSLIGGAILLESNRIATKVPAFEQDGMSKVSLQY